MNTIVIGEQIQIPGWVVDFETFRRWTHSPEYPERGQFAYLDGTLWVDPSMERLNHNQIKGECGRVLTTLAKGEISRVLRGLAKTERRGIYLGDRMLLTHPEVELSTEPDGMFLSNNSVAGGLVLIEDGDDCCEVVGTPDMVLEVVSATSEEKDLVLLRRLYWEARIPEYWLVDSRVEKPELDILRHSKSKYIKTRKESGWVRSAVFGKEFRLVHRAGQHRVSDFTLEMR